MVAKLKANVMTLEGQVNSLKADLTEVRQSHSLSSGDHRDSLSAFDNSLAPPQTTGGPEKSHDSRLSFSYVYKRNKTRDWVPVVSLENVADDETGQGTDGQKDETSQAVPERRCYRSCSIATSRVMPDKHCIHVHARNGVSSASEAVCNGDVGTETADRLSSDADAFNDTLSDLVESNSDTSSQVVDFKVSTTVHCRNHGQTSKFETMKLCNGSASTLEMPKQSDRSTQTSSAKHLSDRCVTANELMVCSLVLAKGSSSV